MAKKISLTRAIIRRIGAAVDKVFDRAVARMTARPPVDKRIFIATKPRVTLPDLYHAATAEEKAKGNQDTINSLLHVAESFIDAQRASTKAQVVKNVEAWLNKAHNEGVQTDVQTILGGQLADVFKKAYNGMHKIVASESNTAKNMGTLEGIVKVNAAGGIEDPVVYFIVVRDDDLCDECRRLHLMDDGRTPRLWYLSEVGQGYHKKGDDDPKVGGLHPHCRCSMVTLMPGYGFDKAGSITYIRPDHDELKKQRG